VTTSRASSRVPTLVLVVGAGRSGTSTVAGCLRRLGFVVPQPEIPANDTNPRGFYEPQWVVDFHQRVLAQLPVRANDARPSAVGLAAEAATRPELLEELRDWLAPLAAEPLVVVKDPRTLWLHGLWRQAAGAVGMEVAFLTMLRAPVEVARSRDQHYLAAQDEALRRARETTNVASWCQAMLVTEAATRGDRRAFVQYQQLMADWREALSRADDQLGTRAMAGVGVDHHAIDDFIDPRLNRSRASWTDLSVDRLLSGLADEIWSVVTRLVDDPADPAATSAMDELHSRYDALYTFAHDLTLDQASAELETHRSRRRELRERQAARLERLQGRISSLEARNAVLARELEEARTRLSARVWRRLRRR
jgi:hypothetical protein